MHDGKVLYCLVGFDVFCISRHGWSLRLCNNILFLLSRFAILFVFSLSKRVLTISLRAHTAMYRLVIAPIERMMNMVEAVASDPLATFNFDSNVKNGKLCLLVTLNALLSVGLLRHLPAKITLLCNLSFKSVICIQIFLLLPLVFSSLFRSWPVRNAFIRNQHTKNHSVIARGFW